MTAQLHIYPGMGATAAMYQDEAWRSLPNALFHDWPEWRGEDSIVQWATRLIDEHNIQPGDIVCGSSLGGMVAAEMANQVDVGGLILLGSATDCGHINRLLSVLHPLIDLTPVNFAMQSAGKVPGELFIMFAKSDAAFIRTMCKAIFQWDGLRASPPTYRIHGSHDRVIPPPEGVEQLFDAGHLIAMTHPVECVAAIKAFL